LNKVSVACPLTDALSELQYVFGSLDIIESDQLDVSSQTIKGNLRRDVAIALLKNSTLSVKEISFNVGYQENSAFSKAFKHWLGVSPTVYRER
jgi:methylphosphotriester-DNA--protein-cysteine methyltransferase